VRTWLSAVTTGQDGSTPMPALEEGHTGSVAPMLLDYEDVADALQVSASTVKRLVRAGELPAVKVARATRVRRDDLAAYVERLRAVPRG
jgi:excisionase family DNA binding protein